MHNAELNSNGKEQENMGKDPAFLFYTADFLVGVTDLSYEERGQYITLLCLQHQKGHLSARTIKNVAPSEAVMDKFLRDAKGRYYNERLDEEKRKREKFIQKQYENGKKGGRPRKNQEKPTGYVWVNPNESQIEAKENPSENENVNVDSFTLVKDSTEAMSLSDSAFSFSNDNNDNNLLSTATTNNNGSFLYRENEDEDGLTWEEREVLSDELYNFFGEEGSVDKYSDTLSDFIAYNKARGWRGLGGEDIRGDLRRYLRRWIKYDYPERES